MPRVNMRNFSETTKNIKLKISIHVKEDVELTKRHYIHNAATITAASSASTTTATTITTTTKAKTVKVKFSGIFWEMLK